MKVLEGRDEDLEEGRDTAAVTAAAMAGFEKEEEEEKLIKMGDGN